MVNMLGKKELQNKLKSLEAKNAELETKIEECERQRASDKAHMQAAIENEKRSNEQNLKDTIQAKKDLEDMTNNANNLRDKLTTTQNELEKTEESVKKLMNDLDTQKISYAQLSSEYAALDEKCQEKENEILKLKKIVKQKSEISEKGQLTEGKVTEELTLALNRANELEVKLSLEQKEREQALENLRNEVCELEQMNKEKQEAYYKYKAQAENDSQVLQNEISELNSQLNTQNEKVELLIHCNNNDTPRQELKKKLLELQDGFFLKSDELIVQAEKNMKLTEKLLKLKDSYSTAKDDLFKARELLLVGIGGPEVDTTLYTHVKLKELIRLRLQVYENEVMGASSLLSESPLQSIDSDGSISTPSLKCGTEALGSIGKLEREMRLLRSRNKKMQERTEELEGELEQAMAALDDVKALKGKTVELAGRQRTEKDLRLRTELLAQESNEKIFALSEHIEKLMVHLKHEAAAKAKAIDAQKRLEKEISQLKQKNASLVKKNGSKDKIVTELEEGSKILEDQLRLMDEKYIELRSKLDWSRSTSQKEVKKLQNELSAIRAKWQFAVDMGQIKPLSGPLVKIGPKKKGKLPRNLTDSEIHVHPSNNRTRSPSEQPQSKKFDIPSFPENGDEGNMPWSDAKLDSLKKQCNSKKKENF